MDLCGHEFPTFQVGCPQAHLLHVEVRHELALRHRKRRDAPIMEEAPVEVCFGICGYHRRALVKQRKGGAVIEDPCETKPLLLSAREDLFPDSLCEPTVRFTHENVLHAACLETTEQALETRGLAANNRPILPGASSTGELTLQVLPIKDPRMRRGHSL